MNEKVEPKPEEKIWLPGDPCAACGSTDTVLCIDGVIEFARCNGCHRTDLDE